MEKARSLRAEMPEMGAFFERLVSEPETTGIARQREMVAGVEAVHGPMSHETAVAKHELARDLRNRGELDESLSLTLEALETFRGLYGEGHMRVVRELRCLGIVMLERDDCESAESILWEVIHSASASSLVVTDARKQIAYLTMSCRSDPDAALAMMRSVMEDRIKSIGRWDYEIASLANELGNLARIGRRFSEAECAYLEAKEILELSDNERAVLMAVVLEHLGDTAFAMDDPARAAQLYAEADALASEILPEGGAVRVRINRKFKGRGL
jgi:hypothetical protein